MIKENFKQHGLYLLLIIFTVIFQFRNFIIYYYDYPAGMDSLGPISVISFFSRYGRYFDIWNEVSVGYVTPIILYHLLAFINSIFNNPVLIIKSYIIILSIVSGIFMYYFTFSLTNNKLCGLVSTFVFLYNRWITVKISCGHYMHATSYLILPILFYFLNKYLRNKNDRYLIVLALIFSLILTLRWDPIVYVVPFVIIYLVFSIPMYKVSIKFLLRSILITLILFLVTSMYLWLPILIIKTSYATLTYSLGQIEKFSLDLYPTILGHPRELSYEFWIGHTDWNTHPFLSLWQYYLSMSLIPILALIAVILRKGSWETLLFISEVVVSLFLAKGPHPPFGEIYGLLIQTFSVFKLIHVPNRFLMITWFFYSLLVGLALSSIYQILKRKFSKVSLTFLFSSLVVLILLIGILLPNFFILTHGYLTWKPPNKELEPYKFLANKSSDGRIITVPYAQPYMFNQYGWMEQDIGWISYMYSGKSVLCSLPDFRTFLSDFNNYIKNIIKNNKTNKLSKILGIYDVKYIVLQGYPQLIPDRILKNVLTYYQHNFFEKQLGLIKIYKSSDQNYYSLKVGDSWAGVLAPKLEPPKLHTILIKREPKIYENQYWIPRIFSPSGTILVVGGLDTFLKFAEIDSFNFSDWNLLFADHIVENLGKEELIKQVKKSNYIAFVNSEPLDLAMLLANVTWIKVKNFEKDSKGWHEDDQPIIEGYFVYYRDVISTKEKGAKAIYKIKIDEDFTYEIWIRTFLHNKGGKLKIIIDKKPIGEIDAYNPQKLGFKWIKVGEIKLNRGTHIIEILNINGENMLNGIIIAKQGEIKHALSYTKQLMRNKSIYLLDIEKLKKIDIDPVKYLKEEVIFDDYWVTKYFWSSSFPENIKIRDSNNNKVSGVTSLRIDITPRPEPGEVASKRFYELQDWSGIRYISFWFKGTGKGEEFNLWIYFNNSKWPNPDAVRFGPFYDNSKEWRRIVIPVDKPAAKYGKIMWNKVSRIVLAIPDKNFKGTIYLDRFSIYRGNIDRTKLEKELNAKVLLFRDSKPIGSYIIQPKSKSNVTYIEFKKINPSKWIVKVNSTGPYTLVFSNTYHKMWKAYVNGKEYNSIPSYYFINSFQINETGEHEVVIEFIGQRIQEISLIISGLAHLGCFTYLLYDWRREKGDKWTLKVEKKVKDLLQKVIRKVKHE